MARWTIRGSSLETLDDRSGIRATAIDPEQPSDSLTTLCDSGHWRKAGQREWQVLGKVIGSGKNRSRPKAAADLAELPRRTWAVTE